MDDRVVEHYKGQLDKINVHSTAKEKMLQKYAVKGEVV
jgi:alkane 1-monooxygenase